MRGFDGVIFHDLFPEQLAVGAIEAPQGALVPLGVQRLRQENAIAPHDRSGMRFFGQRDLPFDVLLIAPGGGQVLLGRLSVAVGTAPAGPVVGGREGGDEEEGGGGNQHAIHGCVLSLEEGTT